MATTQPEKITFNRKEAARKLGVSVVTLDREVKNNNMPHVRIGRRVLFTQILLENYIERSTKGGE